MVLRERLLLGAPDIYPLSSEPLRALSGVRMDVAAFVGVAPRGPCRLPAYHAPWADPPRGLAAPTATLRSHPVRVDSWDGYRRLFGGFEGPGLLPYAVATFFENGGRRAYVVRVVHDYGAGHPDNETATAAGVVPGLTPRGGGELLLRARDEGSWGNRLKATIQFRKRPLPFLSATELELTLDADSPGRRGSLLRLWLPDGAQELRFIVDTREGWSPQRATRRVKASFNDPLPAPPERAELVEADLAVTDTTRDGMVRGELHQRLGLSPLHPRWLASILYSESALVYPDESWIADDLIVDDIHLNSPIEPNWPQFRGGRDRYAEIVQEDFFDPAWLPQDEQPRSGVHSLAELEDLSIVVAPDLYSPAPLAAVEDEEEVVTLAGACFEPCAELPPASSPPPPGDGSGQELEGLRLDPTIGPDLARIIGVQRRLLDLAELLGSWIVLLDVPPGLTQRQILGWRAEFSSAWAAGYHPWVRAARPDDAREPLVTISPSAFAAGVIARHELAFGVPHGPANEALAGAVSVVDSVSRSRHDELHQSSVNVLIRDRDGIRLTAARTLSDEAQWRQLSVRRLMTMLSRTLQRQMQWAVFEPNDARLRDELKRLLETYLHQLFRANAFRGRTPAEAYFVRCDESLNTQQVIDQGRLICHVGVAPAEPLEFIVLRISRDGEGALRVEE